MRNTFVLLFFTCFLFQSCGLKKDVIYFQDNESSQLEMINYSPAKIQSNDILSISVSSIVPEAAIPYNMDKYSIPINNSDLLKLQGYLVSKSGAIVFPVLGNIHVAGKTPSVLETELKGRLQKGGHLLKPIVNVRVLNNKITILGEVNNPGTYNYSESQLSIPQAIGYAGDLTIQGNRKDILLIREENGKRKVFNIDLTKTDWFSQPYYYIKQNDLLVVNPNTSKVRSAGLFGKATDLLSLFSVILSTTVLITN